MIIKYSQYSNKRTRKILRKKLLRVSGVYAYYCIGIPIYVGATGDLYTRIFRVYTTSYRDGNIIFRELMRRIGSYKTLDIHIYFCPKDKLIKKERNKINLLKPISQALLVSQEYFNHHIKRN